MAAPNLSPRPALRLIRPTDVALAREALEVPADAKALRIAMQMDTVAQCHDALARMDMDFSLCPRLPWEPVDRMTGPILPDHWWLLVAHSGNGKTTTVMECVRSWVALGLRVYVMTLEQQAKIMRAYWAALEVGVMPKHVIRNDWSNAGLALDGSPAYEAVRAHLRWQQALDGGEALVHFSKRPFAGEKELRASWDEAAAFRADIIIIDHFHRLRSSIPGHAGTVSLSTTLKERAKEYEIPVLTTGQVNQRHGDILARYRMPEPGHIQDGDVLYQEADLVMGVHRPLLDTFDKDAAMSVRMNPKLVRDWVKPDVVAVSCLKDRVGGEFFGQVELDYHRGRIVDPGDAARDHWVEVNEPDGDLVPAPLPPLGLDL